MPINKKKEKYFDVNVLDGPFIVFMNKCFFASKYEFGSEKIIMGFFLWKCLPNDEKKKYQDKYLEKHNNVIFPDLYDYKIREFEEKCKLIKNNDEHHNRLQPIFIEKKFDEKKQLVCDIVGFNIAELISNTYARGSIQGFLRKCIFKLLDEKIFNKNSSGISLSRFDYLKLSIIVSNYWERLNRREKVEIVSYINDHYYKKNEEGNRIYDDEL